MRSLFSEASMWMKSEFLGQEEGRQSPLKMRSSPIASFETLEDRRMFSASLPHPTPAPVPVAATLNQPAAIASAIIGIEYAQTAFETDAYGQQVQSLIGGPTSGIVPVRGVTGAYMESYHDNGVIYYSPATGAHLVMGGIGAEYAQAAQEYNSYGVNMQSVLGLPTSDETNIAGVVGGRMNTFQYGAIDWSANTGAHAVIGGINSLYQQMGAAGSWLGLPTTDEAGTATFRTQYFQNGYIQWNPYTGSTAYNDTISISTRYGDELVITATGTHDNVTVNQVSSSFLVITADGQISYAPATDNVFVYTRGGSDSVIIQSSVTAQTTVECIDNAPTTVFALGSHVITWADSSDAVYGGAIHYVNSFAGGVSKAVGASLADPADSGPTFRPSASLFGDGPAISDINQGALGDCWLVSSLGAVAQTDPNAIRNTAVDLGDGTYAVELYKSNGPEFIRVNGDLSAGGFNGYAFAHPGPNGTIWAAIIEKAYAYFRNGSNTYASINAGGEYVSEPLRELGFNTQDVLPSNTTDDALYAQFSYDLANGIPVAANIPPIGNLLVVDHCYSLERVETVNGVHLYTLRNPWGEGDSQPGENSTTGEVTLTFQQMVANVGWMTEALPVAAV